MGRGWRRAARLSSRRIAANEAFFAWRELLIDQELELLSAPSVRPEGVSEGGVAIAILTTDPEWLFSDEERAECLLMRSWGRTSEWTPDWTRVATRVEEIFNEKAVQMGIDSQLMLTSVRRGRWVLGLNGAERLKMIEPGYSRRHMLEGLSPERGICDRRREKRRLNEKMPPNWGGIIPHELACKLWSGGASRKKLESLMRSKWKGDWIESALALRDAMEETGAAASGLIRDYFKQRPSWLYEPEKIEAELQAGNDPIEELWALNDMGRGVAAPVGSLSRKKARAL